ncbi:MAG: nuclear transport factor 2 family protein [Gammaproteobacteria bacterium]|nr:nuclear transport factor 2 family protein [Gammaproteobacteria bacterium]
MKSNKLRLLAYRPHLIGTAIFLTVALAMPTGSMFADQHRLSDRHKLEIDNSIKEHLGEKTAKEVMSFFHRAETAIQSRDLEAIMALYSDGYRDGDHDKAAARKIWERIFKRFTELATRHNMSLVTTSSDKDLVIMRCSGILLGIPEGSGGPIPIDNWNQQDHVLKKEDGQWKLIGTFGRERKRLWFDKHMHPLF